MTLREIMTSTVVRIHPEEPVAVAARLLRHYNIGMLPVCGRDGRLQGVVTDRDIVTRCVCAGRSPEKTSVGRVMTTRVISAPPDTDARLAARLMGKNQVRRLPVTENGRLCGIVSLGDLAGAEETAYDAGDALADISSGLSKQG